MTLAAINFLHGGPLPDLPPFVSTRDLALRYVREVFTVVRESRPTMDQLETVAMDEIDNLMQQALKMGAAGATARMAGEEKRSRGIFP